MWKSIIRKDISKNVSKPMKYIKSRVKETSILKKIYTKRITNRYIAVKLLKNKIKKKFLK